MRVTHTHGSSVHKKMLRAYVVLLLTSPSPFPCFTRLPLLFLHGHSETKLTDALIHTLLPNFPDPKAPVKRTLHKDEQSGYLAKSVPNKIFRRSVDDTDHQTWNTSHNGASFWVTLSLMELFFSSQLFLQLVSSSQPKSCLETLHNPRNKHRLHIECLSFKPKIFHLHTRSKCFQC